MYRFSAPGLHSARVCARALLRSAYVDDSWITTKVKSDMMADKRISSRNIGVNTTKGVLTGTVATAHESNQAAAIARGVAGVKAVKNDIRIE